MPIILLTPTQLIRKAALQTHRVVTGNGKEIEYNEIEYEPVPDPFCFLCGGQTNGLGVSKAKGIKKTFTDHGYARRPDSKSLCQGCAYCLSHASFRNFSIVATEKQLWHPTRPEMRDMLLNPPSDPFVFCVAQSGQKWVHYKSKVNYDNRQFFVAMEDSLFVVNRDDVGYLLELIEPLLTTFTKTEIETGEYNQKRIMDYGLSTWRKAERELQRWRGSLFFTLIVQVAQKRDQEQETENPKAKEQTKDLPLGQLSLFDLEGLS